MAIMERGLAQRLNDLTLSSNTQLEHYRAMRMLDKQVSAWYNHPGFIRNIKYLSAL
jgi:hypothetical protein